MNKLTNILFWTIVVLLILAAIAFIIIPLIIGNINGFYIHFFLVLFLIQTLGVLRLYNSVFHNTRFIVELSKKLNKLMGEFPVLEHHLRDSTASTNRASARLHETVQALKDGNVDIELLSDEIKKWRQQYGNTTRNNRGNSETIKRK